MSTDRTNCVGPVLELSDTARQVVDVLRDDNPGLIEEERGSYIRVLVPFRCLLRADAVSRALGRTFCLPGDLELIMLSFKGEMTLGANSAEWRFAEGAA